MKPDLLGAGCYEYTDEYEAAVACCTAENAKMRKGMENNAYLLEELALGMDAVAAGSEQGLEQEKVAQALQVKVEEQGPEQEDLKEAALTLQVEKVEIHLRAHEYIAFAASKNTYESDSFEVSSVASTLHAMK